MTPLNKTQQRVLKVLERITEAVTADVDDAEMYGDELDHLLDEMASCDCFGTEGQLDPRGDQRNGDWFIGEAVEGVD